MPKLKTVAPLPEQTETQPDTGGRQLHLETLESAVIGPRLAGTEDAGVASPALSLQQLLIDGWEEGDHPEDSRRWPPGVTILVSGGSAIVLWGLIIWAALTLLHIHLS